MLNSPALVVKLEDGSDFTMYTPSPKQRLFHESDATNLAAIGSRGGGKSLMLRMDAHMRALSCPGSNLVLIRKTYKDLMKNHVYFQGLPWGSLKQEMKLLGGDFHSTNYICQYPNGSKLFLSYVGHESDTLNLLGSEFIGLYVDEISTIPWEHFLKLSSSVRAPMGSGWKAVVRAATNPLGESAMEVMKHFVYKEVDASEEQDYYPDDWSYIQIDMNDNPHLDIEQYKKRLAGAGLPEHVRKAWLEGIYSDEEALFSFYPTRDSKPYHVIRDVDIPDLIKKGRIYRAFDMGFSPDPAYCAWIAHLGNRYVIFHEKFWLKTVVPDIAASILEEDKFLGITKPVTTYCDPSMDIKTGDVRTIKDLFEYNHIYMEPSTNNRTMFAAAWHAALGEEAAPGVPKIQIYNPGYGSTLGCPYLCKSIPMQRYNPKNPLAMDDQKHDHPVVAVSYFLISHSADEHRTLSQRKYPKWMQEKKKDSWLLGKNNVRTNTH